MKPYPSTSTQFNVDEYLDRHKDAPVNYLAPEHVTAVMQRQHEADLKKMAADFAAPAPTYNEMRFAGLKVEQPFSFRGWAIRLNDRMERWMDSIDWIKWDIRLGTIGGFLLTGTSLYLIAKFAEAWILGRFNFGAN